MHMPVQKDVWCNRGAPLEASTRTRLVVYAPCAKCNQNRIVFVHKSDSFLPVFAYFHRAYGVSLDKWTKAFLEGKACIFPRNFSRAFGVETLHCCGCGSAPKAQLAILSSYISGEQA